MTPEESGSFIKNNFFPTISYPGNEIISNRIKLIDWGQKYFILFGEIPKNECSLGDHIDGISVYECCLTDTGEPQLILPNPLNKNLNTLRMLLNYSKGKMFLVTGDIIGKGFNNEPLIKNIKIIKKYES